MISESLKKGSKIFRRGQYTNHGKCGRCLLNKITISRGVCSGLHDKHVTSTGLSRDSSQDKTTGLLLFTFASGY